MVMWDEIATQIAAEFKDVIWDKMLVDAMTMRMVMRPETIDTVVATNLHADVLSDLAAALAGSLGIAPTANLNPGGPSLRCLSRSTGRRSTSWGKAWPIPSAPSGLPS
jgi:tartrate dehydrogenase/decarboxylase/D-malate dehydrogenase